MAIRRIVMSTEPSLRKKSREVEVFDDRLWVLLDDMYETMSMFGGMGIAAPQVGILRRAVIIEHDGKKYEFVNPVITAMKGRQREIEGCLSSPGEWGYVVRPEVVTVKAYNRYGKEFAANYDGILAIAVCHEIDHLNGVLFADIADEMVEDDNEVQQARSERGTK